MNNFIGAQQAEEGIWRLALRYSCDSRELSLGFGQERSEEAKFKQYARSGS